MPGVRAPSRETGYGYVLSILSHPFLSVALRMQVELQPFTLDVAGSTPAGFLQTKP